MLRGGVLAGLAAAMGGGAYVAARGTALTARCTFGAWAAGPDDLATNHIRLEELVGARLPVVSWYADWDTPWQGALADAAAVLARRGDYRLLISWEPVGVPFVDVLNGSRDESLQAFLDGARSHPGGVLLRPFAEMNGPWQTWSLEHDESLAPDPATWVATWRHLVDLARSDDDGDVQFLFCANTTDGGNVPMEAYWPGHRWVDRLGIDGFNWDFFEDGRPADEAEAVIGPMYERLTALHPRAEVTMCEISCAEGPGKAAWFEALYSSRRFPRLTEVVLFHENKERDWRLDSDPQTLAVTRNHLRRQA